MLYYDDEYTYIVFTWNKVRNKPRMVQFPEFSHQHHLHPKHWSGGILQNRYIFFNTIFNNFFKMFFVDTCWPGKALTKISMNVRLRTVLMVLYLLSLSGVKVQRRQGAAFILWTSESLILVEMIQLQPHSSLSLKA